MNCIDMAMKIPLLAESSPAVATFVLANLLMNDSDMCPKTPFLGESFPA